MITLIILIGALVTTIFVGRALISGRRNVHFPETATVTGNSKSSAGTLLLGIGIVLMVTSIAAYFWARNYIETHLFQAGFSGLMGNPDSTFQLARGLVDVSPLGFIVGLVLLIVGVVMAVVRKA